jgi:valyl-tRNA synthetase
VYLPPALVGPPDSCLVCRQRNRGEITDDTPFVVAISRRKPAKAAEQFGEEVLQRDPDVLDTWFSSGLWPFSTMGWPDTSTKDFQTYYPTTTLVTGFDIIFFWVARMTMMAGHFTDTMPFETVYIHGLVRDENNKKMSKSANNGIDPLVLINKYGTDALRYTLIREVAGAGQDIRLEYDRKTDESASRWKPVPQLHQQAVECLPLCDDEPGGPNPAQLGQPDAWPIWNWPTAGFSPATNGVVQSVRDLPRQVRHWGSRQGTVRIHLGRLLRLVHRAGEVSPARGRPLQKGAAANPGLVLDGILKLLHPFMPHITEEVWHTLNQASDEEPFWRCSPIPEVHADADQCRSRSSNLTC